MLALLLGLQFATQSFGQFVTGSLVNLVLFVSAFIIGPGGSLIVALLSPILAFFLAMGPMFVQVIPFAAVGNAILTLTAQLARKHIAKKAVKDIALTATGIIAAGAAKTLFFWLGLVVIALPILPGISNKQMTVISSSFTWPQMVTAVIGGALAMIIVPLLKKAMQPSAGKQPSSSGDSE